MNDTDEAALDTTFQYVFGETKLPETQKLGAHVASVHADIKLEDHVSATAALIPPSTLIHQKHVGFNWGMLGNDTVGDCVIAMMLHTIEAFYLANGMQPPTIYTAAQAIQIYSAITGYVPGDENTDNGTDENVAMNYWKSPGLLGDTIAAVASIDVSGPNVEQVCRIGMAEFGAVQLAVDLPITAQNRTSWRQIGGLTGNGAPGSWGGHGVPVIAYAANGDWWVITWGSGLNMGPVFRRNYVVQMYIPLSRDFISTKTGVSPLGVNWDTLNEELATLS